MGKLNRVGEKYTSTEGYIMEIIEYPNAKNCTVLFEDGTIVKNIYFGHIKRGNVKNNNHLSIFGVACFGNGPYKGHQDGKREKSYNTYTGMLERCYDSKRLERHPSYQDCTVCDYWLNFQNFAQWFYLNHKKGYALDKDILIKGNKIYSPETCCFVPTEINSLFTKTNSKRGAFPIGVSKHKKRFRSHLSINKKRVLIGSFKTETEAFMSYKLAKEKHIKEIANKYKNLIEPIVYHALCSYEVEITD